MNDETTASFLDKTDWRITLHRKLEACVDAEGTEYYPSRVKSLISAASAQYPGWDAEKEISDHISFLDKKYKGLWDNWLDNNLHRSKHIKYKVMKYFNYGYYHELFIFIKNMCARKRMLLWGSKKVGGGTQMEYPEE